MTTNDELALLCKNIRFLRSHYKLSQKETAKRLHIGIASLRKIEQGIIPPRLPARIFLDVSRTFAVPIKEVLTVALEQTYGTS